MGRHRDAVGGKFKLQFVQLVDELYMAGLVLLKGRIAQLGHDLLFAPDVFDSATDQLVQQLAHHILARLVLVALCSTLTCSTTIWWSLSSGLLSMTLSSAQIK